MIYNFGLIFLQFAKMQQEIVKGHARKFIVLKVIGVALLHKQHIFNLFTYSSCIGELFFQFYHFDNENECIDRLLRTLTRSLRMVVADGPTELWWPPIGLFN